MRGSLVRTDAVVPRPSARGGGVIGDCFVALQVSAVPPWMCAGEADVLASIRRVAAGRR